MVNWQRLARIFSAVRVFIWLLLVPLSYTLGWLESVTFVALASIYANLASDYAAFRSEQGEQMDRLEAKLDELLER